jgi:RNA polymerase sigma factor for flagellar operon FliA
MSNLSEKEKLALWKEYAKTKDTKIREKFIIEYSNLVKFVAGRLSIYFGTNVEYDDLVSYGIFGLIDAIDKFDINKNVKFETYASLRIRGSIIDSIRELDWVPRSVRKKNKEIEKVYADLENSLGRPANDTEVAEALDITVDALMKIVGNISASSMISLEEFLEQNYETNLNGYNSESEKIPEEMAELNDRNRILGQYIDNLPEKEKMVISLYYLSYLTIKEISAIMDISESRVSQLHTKAILRLRGKMEKLKATLL